MENNESCVDRYDIDAMIDMGYIGGFDDDYYGDDGETPDFEGDDGDDGPSEFTEWMDFDPDC